MATRRRLGGKSTISVEYSGPIFEPTVVRAVVEAFKRDTVDEMAQMGYDELQRRFKQKHRRRTGAYESRVTVERGRSSNERVITDHGVIYGPWLEGTTSRNQNTRFKGYKSFRLTRLKIRRLVKPTAQANLDRYLDRIR